MTTQTTPDAYLIITFAEGIGDDTWDKWCGRPLTETELVQAIAEIADEAQADGLEYSKCDIETVDGDELARSFEAGLDSLEGWF